MRITEASIIKRYGSTLNKTLAKLDKLNQKSVNARKFDSFSENVSGSVRAIRIRNQLKAVEGYQDNLQKAKELMTEVESSMMLASNLVSDAKALVEKAVNGTQGPAERTVIAEELRNIATQMFQSMNAKFSGQFLFGGTQLDSAPLTLDDSGGTRRLLYNGVDVASMQKFDSGTNTWVDLTADEITQLETDPFYMDIGLGLKFESASSNKLVAQSALNASFPAIGVMGYGTATVDGQQVNNNAYLLINDIADALSAEDYNPESVGKLWTHLSTRFTEISTKVTEMGSRSKYIAANIDRYEEQTYNLKTAQNEIEFDDPASVIIEFKMQEMAYRAALQMGAKLLEVNIFNFMS